MGTVFKAIGGLVAALGGPLGKIAATIVKTLAPDLVAIAQAFASPAVIGVITGVVNILADLIKKVPPKVVADLAVALAGVGLALKTIDIAKGAGGRISGLLLNIKGILSGSTISAAEGAWTAGVSGRSCCPACGWRGGTLVATLIVSTILKDTSPGRAAKTGGITRAAPTRHRKTRKSRGLVPGSASDHQIEKIVDGIRIFIVGPGIRRSRRCPAS